MMMFDEMMVMLRNCEKHDVEYNVVDGGVHVMVHDFDGFDEHWNELEHEWADEEAFDVFCEWCEEHCVEQDMDYYVSDVYRFDGFDVVVEYASAEV